MDLLETWLEESYARSFRTACLILGNRSDAEEAVQETWMGVVRGVDRFEGRSSFKTWLFRILINRAQSAGGREHRDLSLSDHEPAVDPAHLSTVVDLIVALTKNLPLIVGFGFHACNALLLILALKEGELSILWPIYALSYVWVGLLSMHFFGDRMNVWKGAGIALIILGVSLLGRASKRVEVLP